MKKLFDKFIYVLAYTGSYFVRFLSTGLRTKLGKFLGRIFMLLFPSRVKIAEDNLKIAFPDKDYKWVKMIAREAFENLGITLAEILAMKHFSREKIMAMFKFGNLDLFKRVHSESKGVILLGAHFGNWELSALAGSLYMGVKYLIIVEHQANDFINDEMNKIRTRFGNSVVSRYAAAREIVKSLQRGEVLALIADQSASERNDVYVNFFGRPAATFDSPAALALKFNIPFLFGVTVRQNDGTYILDLIEIKHDDLEYNKEGILELTKRHVRVLEEAIRENPGHWAWMHRRWKHTPPPEWSDA